MPPPSVRPPTPVVEMIPPGAARPKRQVDDQAAIDGAEAGHAVAPATNRQVEAGVAGSTDHGHHVGRIYALADRAGSAVVHDVVDGAGLVVVGIRGGDDATAHRFGQCLDRVAHGVLLRLRLTMCEGCTLGRYESVPSQPDSLREAVAARNAGRSWPDGMVSRRSQVRIPVHLINRSSDLNRKVDDLIMGGSRPTTDRRLPS